MNDHIKKLLSTLTLSIVLIFSMVLLSQTLGLGKAGFDTESVFKQFTFYVGPALAFLLGILCIYVYEYINKDKDAQYGSGIGYNEIGEFPSLEFFKKISTFQMFLASAIIFGILGLTAFFTKQTSFTGVGVIAQQFTAIDSLIFSSLLIPAAENLGAGFLISFGIFGLRYYARKNIMTKQNFRLFSLTLIPVIVGIYGFSNHLLRYGSQEFNLITVFFFWTIGGLITILTGSFIPFWMMHISNNVFFDLKRFTSNESILIWTSMVLVILIVFYFFLYIKGGKSNL